MQPSILTGMLPAIMGAISAPQIIRNVHRIDICRKTVQFLVHQLATTASQTQSISAYFAIYKS